VPPRFAYWTIILEGKPTAFRAQRQDELLPTLKQLQARHPDVVMKWFAKGRLWNSQEEAHAARRGGERRKPDWRPGGEHRDPRARFDVPRDEKRRRFAAKLRRERTAGERGPGAMKPDQAGRPPRREWKPEDRDRRPPGRPPGKPAWRGRDERSGPADRSTSKPKPGGWRGGAKGPRGPRGPHGRKPGGGRNRGGGRNSGGGQSA
jgi:hypothetical protein